MANQGPLLVKEWIDQISLTTQLFKLSFKDRFRSKIHVSYETENYRLKTADSLEELHQILKLRHQVFCQELQNKKKLFQIELDQHDFKCDHLLIIDRATDQVVGTYRLLSSHFFKHFYSEGEFEIAEFLKVPGEKLELGRACILPDHRSGSVIQLLWRGIAQYMKATDTRYLMGCSSIQTLDPKIILSVTRSIATGGHTDDQYGIKPIFGYRPEDHRIDLTDSSAAVSGPEELPPLVTSYLKAGAKLASTPAIDVDFNCIDFFTILDREKMHPLFLRRYFGV